MRPSPFLLLWLLVVASCGPAFTIGDRPGEGDSGSTRSSDVDDASAGAVVPFQDNADAGGGSTAPADASLLEDVDASPTPAPDASPAYSHDGATEAAPPPPSCDPLTCPACHPASGPELAACCNALDTCGCVLGQVCSGG
jgi:hypothetical protein